MLATHVYIYALFLFHATIIKKPYKAMNNLIKKMKLLCLRKVNSDATGYVQPTQTIQTNLYTICYRRIKRHINFFITPIILSSLIACGGGTGGGGDGNTGESNSIIPSSPGKVTVAPLDFTSMRISWNSVPYVASYEVYNSKMEKVATITPPTTVYTATGLLPNKEYTYSIKACNRSGCSALTSISMSTNDNRAPRTPRITIVNRQARSSLLISWDRISGVSFYEVHNSRGKVATVAASATNHIVTGISGGNKYEYQVRGCYDFGISVLCGDLSPVGSASSPAVPSSITAIAQGATVIRISWDSTPNAASYEVYNNREDKVATIDNSVTNYIASGLLPDTQYTYRIRACNLFGCSTFLRISATTRSAIIVSSAAEFAAIRTNSVTLSGDYILAENIDISTISNWQPIGTSTNVFNGSFDGNGYNISGVGSSSYRYASLFGYVEDASISNIGVIVGNISSRSSYAGGLVGYAVSSSIINSYALVEGDISSRSSYAGGLVGYAVSSSIINSYAMVEGDISSSYRSSSSRLSSSTGGLVGRASNSLLSNSYALVVGDISYSSTLRSYSYVGGLVGDTYRSQIINSYAVVEGDISSSSYRSSSSSRLSSSTGGLVGRASNSPISNSYAVVAGSISSTSTYNYSTFRCSDFFCSPSASIRYRTGTISSSSYAGGLVGEVDGSISISRSYYSASRKPSSRRFSNTLGIFNTVGELQALTVVATGWDRTIWDFGTNDELPTLRSSLFPDINLFLTPSRPNSITATALGFTSLRISWHRVLGAVSYQVHNNEGVITTISRFATSYTDNALSPNIKYTYGVRACNLFGCSDFTSTSATTRDPIIISNANELADIDANSTALSNYYTLTENINLSTIDWIPIGDSINAFTGSFDGNGYNISGVSSSSYEYTGLFGYVRGANINNVRVLVGNISDSDYAGGLIGYAQNSEIRNSNVVVVGNISSSSDNSLSYAGGLIGGASGSYISNSNVVVAGNIFSSSDDSLSYAGGLIGWVGDSQISNSYAIIEGDISSISPRSSNAGGLVAVAFISPISNSYAVVAGGIYSSSISSSSNTGGLAGGASGSPVSNSYAVVAGSISSTSSTSSYAGGLVGHLSGSASISDSYYSASRKSSEGEFTNELGTTASLSGLRRLNVGATGWDEGIWDFGSDNDLPMLFDNPITVDLPLVFRE